MSGLHCFRRGRQEAFTLLEILAVVAIFALIAGIAMPNFSALHSRNLKQQAQRLVSQLELARQRSIVTGVPHRFYIDLDGSAYRIEWLATEAMLNGLDDPGGTGSGDPFSSLPASAGETTEFGDFGAPPIDLSAPSEEAAEYHPIAGMAGRFVFLDESIAFAGVETDGGWVDDGETWIRFERDGSADPTTISIEHQSGGAVTLEVLPLADRIRVDYEAG